MNSEKKSRTGIYRGQWGGKRSARFCLMGLWLVVNLETRNIGIIYNGRWFNFQIQNWPPKFGFWR